MEPSSNSNSKPQNHQQQQHGSNNWFATKINQFHLAHERVKHTVHTAWRFPLPPLGRFAMGCFYFSIPVALGYYTGWWANAQSEATQHERLGDGVNDPKHKIQGIGDKRIVQKSDGEQQQPQLEVVGAGGWGGGVNLATSDQKTQDVNRINLERFRKKRLREKKKREREAAR